MDLVTSNIIPVDIGCPAAWPPRRDYVCVWVGGVFIFKAPESSPLRGHQGPILSVTEGTDELNIATEDDLSITVQRHRNSPLQELMRVLLHLLSQRHDLCNTHSC